ncbi:MAG: putative secretion ATPase, PEP-CTERM locus subfamily [Candidatus Accumulibacter sp. BA-94]|nr:MAG: putative secretion ATPase, PEP-CTERM locus subfamily [Candidatus Accumulibacter sp. BA-94]
MYLEHFGLQQAPFRITPHIEFFFAGANRGATLEALIYAITNDEGIVKVSGEVGSGKTMLCRMLLEKLPENVETVYLANPMLSRDEILFAIAAELGLSLPAGQGQLLLRALQDRLLEIYAAGRQIVVLIDEAHAMPPDALEEIRLLSNLESSRHKLLPATSCCRSSSSVSRNLISGCARAPCGSSTTASRTASASRRCTAAMSPLT